jgi:hypothetical protein
MNRLIASQIALNDRDLYIIDANRYLWVAQPIEFGEFLVKRVDNNTWIQVAGGLGSRSFLLLAIRSDNTIWKIHNSPPLKPTPSVISKQIGKHSDWASLSNGFWHTVAITNTVK